MLNVQMMEIFSEFGKIKSRIRRVRPQLVWQRDCRNLLQSIFIPVRIRYCWVLEQCMQHAI